MHTPVTPFEITLDEAGQGSVIIDGEPVRGTGLWFTAIPREVPRLTIELPRGGTIKAEGVVEVLRDGGEAAADRVRGMDPVEVERKALELMGMGGGKLAPALLQVVAAALEDAT